MPGNFYMGPLPGAPVPTSFLPLQAARDDAARTQRLNDMVSQLQGDVQAATAPTRINDLASQLQGDVQAITNPGAAAPAATSAPAVQPINYGEPMQRATTPQFDDSVFSDQSGPIRYVSNGGTSTVTGGYGDRSQLADWGLARFFGQDNPAQMAQRNATARTMAARNSTEYQNVYQTMLRQTGNPLVASAQADALFAEQMPNYAGDFINSGQDVNTQQRFDQGLARLNAAAAINPELGEDVYRSNLPVWGTYAGGVSPTGESVTVTPDGSTTQMPGVGYSPSLLNGLTGMTGGRSASAKADPNQLTAYQRMQLLQGNERNQQSRISNLNSTLTNLYAQLNNNQRNGGNPAYEQSILGQISAVQTQLNQLTGLSAPAQPVITNSNTGSK
ncbi:MAG: hypothetical protein [Bacteriophage sp.]|nr:MAG: hypothetical protein [Bacteriophage sp.]